MCWKTAAPNLRCPVYIAFAVNSVASAPSEWPPTLTGAVASIGSSASASTVCAQSITANC
eukprot:5584848-Prymnesium_polylepis.1